MDFNEVSDAVLTAVRANGGEMLYAEFQETLLPVVQLSLPRHFDRMRLAGSLVLSVRYDGKAKTTDLYISVPKDGGE